MMEFDLGAALKRATNERDADQNPPPLPSVEPPTQYRRSQLAKLLKLEDLSLCYVEPVQLHGDLTKERFKCLCNAMVLYRAKLMAEFYEQTELADKLTEAWRGEERLATIVKSMEGSQQ